MVVSRQCYSIRRISNLAAGAPEAAHTREGPHPGARRRGEDFGTYQYAARETLELSPSPAGSTCAGEGQKLAVARVAEIDAEAADSRERTGIQPGPRRHSGPESREPSPQDREIARAGRSCRLAGSRRELRSTYFRFVDAYRSAAEKLRAGRRDRSFLWNFCSLCVGFAKET